MVWECEAVIDALRRVCVCVCGVEGWGGGGDRECIKKGSSSLIPSSSERKGLVSKTGRGPPQL